MIKRVRDGVQDVKGETSVSSIMKHWTFSSLIVFMSIILTELISLCKSSHYQSFVVLIAVNVLRPAPQKKYTYFNSIELYSIYKEQLISFNSLIYKNGIISFICYARYRII